jgi:hypothetical protein
MLLVVTVYIECTFNGKVYLRGEGGLLQSQSRKKPHQLGGAMLEPEPQHDTVLALTGLAPNYLFVQYVYSKAVSILYPGYGVA